MYAQSGGYGYDVDDADDWDDDCCAEDVDDRRHASPWGSGGNCRDRFCGWGGEGRASPQPQPRRQPPPPPSQAVANAPPLPVAESSAESAEKLTNLCDQLAEESKRDETSGFLDKDGNRRPYDAPSPPTDVEWTRLLSVLLAWRGDGSSPPQDVDGDAPLLLMTAPIEDDFYEDDVRGIVREAEEILRPIVLSPDDAGRPRRWTPAVERHLAERGIKLADSMILTVNQCDPRRRFGVRVFHLIFRFFVLVVVAGTFLDSETTEFSLVDKRIVGFYYLAMSVEQAVMEHCV